MRTAFEPAATAQIQGSWILVDDVLTTGATTDGVAAVLKNLGAERVVVWAVARAVLEINRPPTRQA
jgi:predicted amidophosphoribosyltransferase